VRGADQAVCGAAHLTFPGAVAPGSLPLPPEGRRGALFPNSKRSSQSGSEKTAPRITRLCKPQIVHGKQETETSPRWRTTSLAWCKSSSRTITMCHMKAARRQPCQFQTESLPSYSAAGIEVPRRSFNDTELLKRADLAGSKRNSAVAALQVIFLTQQLAVGKRTSGASCSPFASPRCLSGCVARKVQQNPRPFA